LSIRGVSHADRFRASVARKFRDFILLKASSPEAEKDLQLVGASCGASLDVTAEPFGLGGIAQFSGP
jgi:hypothetical protein